MTTRLTEADVIAIRRSMKSRAALATQFGVSTRTIDAVCNGESFQHVKPSRAVKRQRNTICSMCNMPFKHVVQGGARRSSRNMNFEVRSMASRAATFGAEPTALTWIDFRGRGAFGVKPALSEWSSSSF